MAPLIDVASLARSLAGGPGPVLLGIRWPGICRVRCSWTSTATCPGRRGRAAVIRCPRRPGSRQPCAGPGVRDGRDVVVYDEADAMAAARGWWLLRYFGHDRVQVLDGGYRAWVAAGQPVATGDEHAALGDFTARPGGLPLLDAAGAAGLARHGLLLDARAAERYRGDTEPVDPVAGHIPGAVSAPADGSLGPDGRFLPPDRLRARFAALAAPAGVGVYCGSGVTAAHEVLALALAGQVAALYAGSWSHWITDPGRPVATGPAPG